MLLSLVLAPFVGSLLAISIPSGRGTVAAWLAGAVALFCLATSAGLYPMISGGHVLHYELAWMPELGLNFTLRMDGFGWMFSSLVSAIALLVVVYARYYMSPSDPVPRVFSLFLAFMGAIHWGLAVGRIESHSVTYAAFVCLLYRHSSLPCWPFMCFCGYWPCSSTAV